MISEEVKIMCELYRRGLYEHIQWFDRYQGQIVKFHEKQVDAIRYFNDGKTTYVGYGGAARGGKSLLISFLAVIECLSYPGTRYLIGRKSLTLLWQTTWKTLYKLLDTWGLKEKVDWRFNGQRYELTFANGSMIMAKNLELKPSDVEATEFGSLEVTKAFIDQSEHVDIKIIEKIGERVGSHMSVRYGLKGKVLEAFNPARSHVHRRYWQPFRDNREKETRKFVRALPSDNPGMEAKLWVEQKIRDYHDGTMSEVEYQKQILGNFDYDDSPDALIMYDEILRMFENDHVMEGKDRYLTADIAGYGSDKFRLCVWYGFRAVKWYEMGKSDAEDIVKWINQVRSEHKIPITNTIFDADGVGDILRGKPLKGAVGFKANFPAVKVIGKRQNYDNLKTQCAYLLAETVNAHGVFICADLEEHEREMIIDEVGQLRRKDMDGDKLKIIKKDEMKKNLGRSPDYLDNLIMRMFFVLRPNTTQKSKVRFSRSASYTRKYVR
jgi:phage terminase large subunit